MEVFFKKLFDHLTEGAYILDKNRRIILWNKAAEKITGYSVSEVIGKSCQDNILRHVDMDGNNLCKTGCPMLLVLNGQETIEADVFLHHKEGYRIPVHIKGLLLPPLFLKEYNLDESSPVALELFHPLWQGIFVKTDELKQLAFLDPLTECLNRRGLESLFYFRLQEMLSLKKKIGVLFFDMDNFKSYNDTYGHAIGDRILMNTAMTVKQTLRPFDLWCRWEGEEFVAILFVDDVSQIVPIAKRCLNLISSQFIETPTGNIHITASIGVTALRSPEGVQNAIERADNLMYQAKRQGKNRIVDDLS
ncbi:sensor domain-containing diguanylate cyclase [Thermospira aquatica]|uniref:diguanylate cyclase n=1 Tax=Thermospira aquatica TaxID=2828656 RepID=A0AAX3BC69_9SPIR|nr:diguanylate cyclase [Thermospira aquatica]URA09746.1 diguanylate cyclase [Thermospira aquatica]